MKIKSEWGVRGSRNGLCRLRDRRVLGAGPALASASVVIKAVLPPNTAGHCG